MSPFMSPMDLSSQTREQIAAEIGRLFEAQPLRVTLSCPLTGGRYIKFVCKPSKYGYRLEQYTDKQVFHANCTAEEAPGRILSEFGSNFRELNALTASEALSLRLSKGGKLLTSRKKTAEPVPPPSVAHNRAKNYIIRESDRFPVLEELGILTGDGHVHSAMYDKFRQINRYIEFIDDIVRTDPRKQWNIIDFGCGKSYLTFVLYHYLTVIRGVDAHIVGLDLKEDVIRNCSALAERHGMTGLSFQLGDIHGYTPSVHPDMIISLHACDTATDYALANAVNWNTDYILAVPCCQHELNGGLDTPALRLMTKYGILKERFAALATDALRARALEGRGYKTDVSEFIDIAHSPKNILIRAKRAALTDAAAVKRMAEAKAEIETFCQMLGYTPLIVRLLFAEH